MLNQGILLRRLFITTILSGILSVPYKAIGDNPKCIIKYEVKVKLVNNTTFDGIYLYQPGYAIYGQQLEKMIDAGKQKDIFSDNPLRIHSRLIEITLPKMEPGDSLTLYFSPLDEIRTLDPGQVRSIRARTARCLSDNNVPTGKEQPDTVELFCASVPPHRSVVEELELEEIRKMESAYPELVRIVELGKSEFLYVFSGYRTDSEDLDRILSKYQSDRDATNRPSDRIRFRNLKEKLNELGLIVFRIYGQGC